MSSSSPASIPKASTASGGNKTEALSSRVVILLDIRAALLKRSVISCIQNNLRNQCASLQVRIALNRPSLQNLNGISDLRVFRLDNTLLQASRIRIDFTHVLLASSKLKTQYNLTRQSC